MERKRRDGERDERHRSQPGDTSARYCQPAKQLGRLATPFTLGAVDVSALDQDVFLPMSVLNDMRQEAVTMLLAARERTSGEKWTAREVAIDEVLAGLPRTRPSTPAEPILTAEVWRLDDARAAAKAGASEISLDLFLRHPTPPVPASGRSSPTSLNRGVTVLLRTPTIVPPRRESFGQLSGAGPALGEARGLVASSAQGGTSSPTRCELLQSFTPRSIRLGARRIVLSIELTSEEMAEVSAPWQGRGFEVFAYGRPEGMTIEHCVLSAAFDRAPFTCRDLCVQKHPHVELTDPYGYVFPVATDSACRNRLLHSRPVNGAGYLAALWRAGLRDYRMVFNVPGDPVAEVTAAFRALIDPEEGRTPDLESLRRLGAVRSPGPFRASGVRLWITPKAPVPLACNASFTSGYGGWFS